MLSLKQKLELSKLRILQYLSDSPIAKDGVLTDNLPQAERGVDTQNLAVSMLEAGLVERRSDPNHKAAKPYFITAAGTEYLEAARQKALFPEIAPPQYWSTNAPTPDIQRAVADFIRTLPEFGDSGDIRIQQVSQQLAQIIAQSPAKPR
jgi:hypothetical protein